MLKLVVKDFRANESYLLLSLAMMIAIGVGYQMAMKMGSDLEPEIYVLVVILSTMVASKLLILTEAEAGADKLVAGLPVNRKQMVLARYLSLVLIIGMALLVHWGTIQLSADDAMRQEHPFIFRPELWIVLWFLLIVSDAFSFPFHFLFGAVKGALMYGLTLITFMLLTILTITLINSNVAWSHLFLRVSQQPIGLIMAELVAIFFVILGGSVFLSINAFKNKDL